MVAKNEINAEIYKIVRGLQAGTLVTARLFEDANDLPGQASDAVLNEMRERARGYSKRGGDGDWVENRTKSSMNSKKFEPLLLK
jgi:hypothetical protein